MVVDSIPVRGNKYVLKLFSFKHSGNPKRCVVSYSTETHNAMLIFWAENGDQSVLTLRSPCLHCGMCEICVRTIHVINKTTEHDIFKIQTILT